jgi:hypothetical protein
LHEQHRLADVEAEGQSSTVASPPLHPTRTTTSPPVHRHHSSNTMRWRTKGRRGCSFVLPSHRRRCRWRRHGKGEKARGSSTGRGERPQSFVGAAPAHKAVGVGRQLPEPPATTGVLGVDREATSHEKPIEQGIRGVPRWRGNRRRQARPAAAEPTDSS